MTLPFAKDFLDFQDAIGMRESSDNYQCVNTLGYLGRYQFGMARLDDFGLATRISGTTDYSNTSFQWVDPFSEEGFLGSPELQDAVFALHVSDLVAQITVMCGSLVNTTVDGTLLTMSGAVACCHLLGVGGLLDFVKGTIDSDAYGTTAMDYITLFNGYDLSNIDPPAVETLASLLPAHPTHAPEPPQGGTTGGTGSNPSLWSRFFAWLRALF